MKKKITIEDIEEELRRARNHFLTKTQLAFLLDCSKPSIAYRIERNKGNGIYPIPYRGYFYLDDRSVDQLNKEERGLLKRSVEDIISRWNTNLMFHHWGKEIFKIEDTKEDKDFINKHKDFIDKMHRLRILLIANREEE